MKKLTYFVLATLFTLTEIATQVHTALAASDSNSTFPPVVISEMQPGTTASASQEFIELYNQSANAIDLTKEGWQVQIASSTATDWSKAKTISLNGVFYPGRYILLASNYTVTGESKSYLQDYATAQFASGLTATSGHVRVVTKPTLATATQAEDSLEWSTRNSAGQLVSGPITGSSGVALGADIPAGSSLKRKIVDGYFVTSGGLPSDDYVLSPCPSPTATNTGLLDGALSPGAQVATNIDSANQACTTESADTGPGSITPPSSEPPAELLPSDSVVYTAGGIPAADVGLEAPQITELLPNPAAPQTDVSDEFIELYNGNGVNFDLSGFSLLAGATGSQRYTFPAGTSLPPHVFYAFYARDTGLSLANSGGQVILLDPLGNRLGQTSVYSTAKDGQAWALASQQWSWTDAPTPGAANVVHLPVAKVKKASSASGVKAKTITAATSAAAKRTAAKKKTATPKTKTKRASKAAGAASAQTTIERTPIHPGVLALVSVFAILYGVYEYRGDLANKVYQFRSDRAARRALREGNPGR